MRIHVISSKGYYDLLHPLEESIQTCIAIIDSKENKVLYCNITTEYIVETNDPDDLIEEMNNYLNRMLYTGRELSIKKMIKFIEDNWQELKTGNNRFKLKTLIEKRDKLNNEVEELQKKINKS